MTLCEPEFMISNSMVFAQIHGNQVQVKFDMGPPIKSMFCDYKPCFMDSKPCCTPLNTTFCVNKGASNPNSAPMF